MKVKFFVPAVISIVAIGLVIAGCFKNENYTSSCTPKSVASEQAVMAKYASDSSLNVTIDPSGIMYQVINQGTGATPTATSTVTVNYTGRFMTGQKFDAGTGIAFPLNGVIAGWQIGIPKIKEGGIIKLIIPSALAYGCTGYGIITADQPLYFYVELTKVN